MKFYEITILEEASRCLMCYDAPCSKACPAGSNPADFVKAIRLNNRRGGARQALDSNMFGAICAATCPAFKYCEGACIRKKIDRPVSIAMLHSFISQYGHECGFPQFQPLNIEKPKLAVAVFGANMAGLTAAAELAKKSVLVTVYTGNAKPFWSKELLTQLDEREVDYEILDGMAESFDRLGIKFVSVENALLSAEDLQDYSAVVIAEKDIIPSTIEIEKCQGACFTGEYVPGPNDLTFSVKKGKEVARCVLDYAEHMICSAKEENK